MDNSRTYYSREAAERAQREQTISTIVYLVLGLGIGTALALLFAPTSGEKTRETLGSTAEDVLDSGRDAIAPSLKRLEKEFAELRKSIDSRVDDLRK